MQEVDITQLLVDAYAGKKAASDELWGAVYGQLRQIAHRELRGGQGHTLSTTALVHEAYLKLVDQNRASPESRTHFFALSCRAMRSILVDYARRRQALKRGGAQQHVPLDDVLVAAENRAEELIALDEALNRLAAFAPRLVQVVECRYFGGLSVEETAEVLDTSVRTVEREWTRAKAYLYQSLRGDGGEGKGE